jgi:hypothetical protein
MFCTYNSNESPSWQEEGYYEKCRNSFFIYVDILIFQQMLSFGESSSKSKNGKLKNEKNDYHLVFGETKIPHMDKRLKGGEDASYISKKY